MAIKVTCEFCGESFNLKDDAAGKFFKCKSCGTKIRVPEEDFEEEDEFDNFLPPPMPAYRSEDRGRRRRRDDDGPSTLGPAIGLYVTGGLMFLFGILMLAVSLINPEMNNRRGVNPAQFTGEIIGVYTALAITPILAMIIIAGAYCLHSRRMYGLAMTGCIIASVPCCSLCLIMTMPFGIWGIVVLCNSDVKRSFE